MKISTVLFLLLINNT